uniref:Major facilitator superfamily (MFS) profile domain-containing protein n=1 Tax=Ciona savignyi TaxID=51511 RepID=H2Z8M7_CIOSA
MNTEALQKISKFGLYQKRIAFILLLAALVGTPLLFGSVFIMYLPSHRCYVPQLDDNATDSNVDFERVDDEATLSLYLPIEISSDGVKRWSECYRYNYTSQPSFNSSSPKAANQSLVYCDKGWKYNKPDAVTSATTEFNLVCDQSLVRPLFPALQMSGFMVGSLLGGILSDRYGRRKAMLFSMTSLAASILWVGLAQSVLALQIGIFVFGISIIMRAVTSFVLLNEVVCGDRRRTFGILFSVFCAV